MTKQNKIEQIIKDLGKPDDEFNKYHLDEGELRHLLCKVCDNEVPTGEIGELKITGKVLNDAFEKYKQKILDADRLDTSFEYGFYAAIDFAKTQLQQAEKMREALEYNKSVLENLLPEIRGSVRDVIKDAIEEAKQALNNKG